VRGWGGRGWGCGIGMGDRIGGLDGKGDWACDIECGWVGMGCGTGEERIDRVGWAIP